LTELTLRKNKNLSRINLRGFPNLKELSLSDCDIRELNLSGLPELVEISLNGNRNLSIIDLMEFPKIETLFKPEREGNDLKEVLLHKSNKAYPGITKIKYVRDSQKRPTSVEYFDENGQYANLLKYGYAKIIIEYDAGGKEVRKKYTAEELNK
jgi:Leucine-rich repeat (LRR) protein